MELTSVPILWSLVNVFVNITATKKDEICYGDLCFDLRPPWSGFRRPLPAPEPPDKVGVEFYLVTNKTITKDREDWRVRVSDLYKPSIDNLRELDYQNSREGMAVMIHGMYVGFEWNWSVLKEMVKAYLSKKDVNVIIIKWASGANHMYTQLVANTRIVGALGAEFLKEVMDKTDLTPDKIHLIGFSLGGHLAGYIGERIPNIHRITGLDIAGPLFRSAIPKYRLDPTDAKHVDVIHTDTLKFIGLGYGPPAGHIDFYFNGGVRQSGCIVNFRKVMKSLATLKWAKALSSGLLLGACSHIKAIEYWIESIQSTGCKMWGFADQILQDKMQYRTIVENTALLLSQSNRLHYDCTNYYRCAPVGLDTFDHVSSGTYYVETRLDSPYCKTDLNQLTMGLEKKHESSNEDLFNRSSTWQREEEYASFS